LTSIVEGDLFAGTADALGTGPVSVKGEGRLLCRYAAGMPANGVELGGMIEFVSGGGVKVEMADGATQPTGNFSVPLFLLPEGESINPEDVPLEHTLLHVSAEVSTSAVGTRMLVSAQFTSYAGTKIIVQ
jgi:hypothetical protein